MKNWLIAAMCVVLNIACADTKEVVIPRQASVPNSDVYFITPRDGTTVSNPVLIQFGLREMGVAPAGVIKEKTGHHHLLIDTELPKDMSQPILSDEHHKHFGGGQTETKLELTPGKHTLQLLLGDYQHIPHNPPLVSDKITVIVK